MYKLIKTIYWIVCFLFLLVFYRWGMPSWWVNFFASVANIALFIIITESFIHYRAVPIYFQVGRLKTFLGALLLCVLVNGTITLFVTWSIIQPYSRSRFLDLFLSWENLIYGNFFVVAAFTAMSITTKLIYDWRNVKRRMEILEREKTKAELEFLKSQINPHFLFNSLNSIYGQINKENRSARQLLLQFSELLRYQLYECDADFIDIEKEVSYLQAYVEVQRQRQSEKVNVRLDLNGRLSGYDVAPLLFIPFVENAFKYVSHDDERENLVLIELTGAEDSIRFRCCNSKDNHRAEAATNGGGVGLQNIERRLQLIYPDKHRLRRSEDENDFIVELIITL